MRGIDKIHIPRFEGETDKAHDMFIRYLKIGSRRSLAKLAKEVGKKPGYVRQLERWSSKYNWVERIKDYEDQLHYEFLKNRYDILDYAMGKLLSRTNDALDVIYEIAMMPSFSSDIDPSIIRYKLEAATQILDRVGLVAPETPPEKVSITPSQMHRMIEEIYNDSGLDVPDIEGEIVHPSEQFS